MRVLVTGSSGFIASHLTKRLLADGHEVGGLVRYATKAKCPRLADVWSNERFMPLEGDIRNAGRLVSLARSVKFDVVFHMAAFHHVGHSWQQPEECFGVNASGSANVFEAFANSRIVYMSSSEIYGRQDKLPITEDTTPDPASPYAVTKYAGEMQARILAECGRNIVVARCFNVYGPEQSTKALIPALLEKIVAGQPVLMSGDGSQTRDYLYVTDAVDGLVKIAKRGKRGRVYNLCSGKEASIKNIISALHMYAGRHMKVKKVKARPNELKRLLGSAARAKKELGWTPKVRLHEGLKAVVDCALPTNTGYWNYTVSTSSGGTTMEIR